jgi:adenylate kinase family enzyme
MAPMHIAILGNAGSGKSSLARSIAASTGCRVLDLDTVAWAPGDEPVMRPDEDARAAVRDFCERGGDWIVEGCYANLVSAALAFGPKLVFLNPGVEACVANCRSRPWEPHKFASMEAQQAHLAPLLSWVAAYATRSGDLSLPGHLACYTAYTGPKRELKSRPALSPLDPELLGWLRR